jgi:hypothetical protein
MFFSLRSRAKCFKWFCVLKFSRSVAVPGNRGIGRWEWSLQCKIFQQYLGQISNPTSYHLLPTEFISSWHLGVNLNKKKLNKNCLFSGLHNESPAQIKIKLLTTPEKSISIRYAILVYQDQWKHNLITKTYKKQRVSIRCPILVYHKKHTGHEGYQSEFSNFRQ